MRRAIQGFYRRYQAHHDMDRPLLQWIGVVGCLAFPLFYLLRRTSALPLLYDDLWLRAAAVIMCLGLALRNAWPARLKHLYIGYSYATIFYCLSFLLSFTMLKNQGGTPSVVNMVMAAIIIILLADWRNTVAMLVGGYVLSVAAYAATEPVPRIPAEFVMAAAGSVLVVVAGALSHHGQKRAEIERMRRIYAGLAGSIAHEVRTPFAQVRHVLETLAAQVPPGSDKADSIAEGQRAVARGLQSIALTLQQLSDASPQARNFSPLDAEHCVKAAIDGYAYETAQQREKVTVRVVRNFAFRGDRTAFELVIFNLLRNALYYLPLRPQATIELRIECEPGPRVVVRDTGPGISPDVLPRLFGEFQTFGKAEGAGLGLAFCRRAMRAMDGDIECRSVVGEFTEFTLVLPAVAQALVQDAAEAEDTVAEAAGEPLAGRAVLVVDDSSFNRLIIRKRLLHLGSEVIEAEHGAAALRLIDEGNRPDAILMDMHMPGMNGIETTRTLRARGGWAAVVPVLALSANTAAQVGDSARDAGICDFLTKPVDAAQLCKALLAAIGERAQSHLH